jgi:pimeloyl-ACP methyl ester carboxylesterase
MHAVLDAAGSARAVLLASHEGCGMAALYAASYPERTTALALFHPRVVGEAHHDAAVEMAALADMRERWGTQELADQILRESCPTLLASDDDRAWFAEYLRVGASPAVAYSLNRAFSEVDLSGVLPAVRVPTMVLHRGLEQATAVDVASRVPNARCVRVSGDDYLEIYLSRRSQTRSRDSSRASRRPTFPTPCWPP